MLSFVFFLLYQNIYFCSTDYAKAFHCVDHHKLWKILKEMGIPDLLTCLLRNLYAGQEATVRTGHIIIYWFQIRKGVPQGYKLSPCLFNFIHWNLSSVTSLLQFWCWKAHFHQVILNLELNIMTPVYTNTIVMMVIFILKLYIFWSQGSYFIFQFIVYHNKLEYWCR